MPSASKVEVALLFACLGLAVPACNGAPCAPSVVNCSPLYEPSFEKVYANTLQPSCAVSGASCHASEAQKAGLDFGSIDVAYQGLRSIVTLDDVACSPLLARLESDDRAFQMPPGRPLSPEERCSVRRFIEAGALR